MLRRVLILLALTTPYSAQQTPRNNSTGADGAVRSPAASPPSSEREAPPVQIEIAVEQAGPLAEFTRQLQYKLGVPISYEDIPWVNRDDVMHVTLLRRY